MTTDTAPAVAEPYRIPAANMPSFAEKMAVIARRADKLHLGVGITWTEVGRERFVVVESLRNDLLTTLPEAAAAEAVAAGGCRVVGEKWVHLVTVDGAAPKLSGWELLAVLEHAGEAGTILRAVPGTTTAIPERFRHVGQPSCDHCKVRRFRRDTFVVAHEDGRTAEVGRQCLRDFTGHASPEAIARFAEYLMEAAGYGSESEEWAPGGGDSDSIPLHAFLTQTASVIRQNGWMSRTKAAEFDKPATADIVSGAFSHDTDIRRAFHKEFGEPTAADEADATEAVAWARSLRDSGAELDDYLWNVSVVAMAAEGVKYRRMGLAASIVAVHLRNREREIIKRSQRAAGAASQHFGEVGKRGVFTLTLQFEKYIEGDYGGTHLHRLVDDAGNVAVWFASGASPWEPTGTDGWQVGVAHTVKATVKRHDTRDDVAQTILTRVAPA